MMISFLPLWRDHLQVGGNKPMLSIKVNDGCSSARPFDLSSSLLSGSPFQWLFPIRTLFSKTMCPVLKHLHLLQENELYS